MDIVGCPTARKDIYLVTYRHRGYIKLSDDRKRSSLVDTRNILRRLITTRDIHVHLLTLLPDAKMDTF